MPVGMDAIAFRAKQCENGRGDRVVVFHSHRLTTTSDLAVKVVIKQQSGSMFPVCGWEPLTASRILIAQEITRTQRHFILRQLNPIEPIYLAGSPAKNKGCLRAFVVANAARLASGLHLA